LYTRRATNEETPGAKKVIMYFPLKLYLKSCSINKCSILSTSNKNIGNKESERVHYSGLG